MLSTTQYLQEQDLFQAATWGTSAFGTPVVDFSTLSPTQRSQLIQRASRLIDSKCKQTYTLTNVTEQYLGRGSNKLYLRKYPLAKVLSPLADNSNASGYVSNSLVADTTLAVASNVGDTTVTLASTVNLLRGQSLVFGDANNELMEIININPATNQVTVTLPLTKTHPMGGRVVVNTIDYIRIIMPGSNIFPVYFGSMTVDDQRGTLLNYTPLMVQTLGYTYTFPRNVPLEIRYTYGCRTRSEWQETFPNYPEALVQVCLELCIRLALRSANPAAGGISSERSGDQQITFKEAPLFTPEMEDALIPFMKDRGMIV